MASIACPHCNGTGRIEAGKASVGAMIVTHRKAKKITQEELAGRVGMSRGQIANIEVGRSDMPISRLAKIADALGVAMKDLLP